MLMSDLVIVVTAPLPAQALLRFPMVSKATLLSRFLPGRHSHVQPPQEKDNDIWRTIPFKADSRITSFCRSVWVLCDPYAIRNALFDSLHLTFGYETSPVFGPYAELAIQKEKSWNCHFIWAD